MRVLAPKIASQLKPGGFWSLVGGTKKAYPALQAKASSPLLRWLSGAGSRRVADEVLNPDDLDDVIATMRATASSPARAKRSRRRSTFPTLTPSWRLPITVDGSRR